MRVSPIKCIITGLKSFPHSFAICVAFAGLSFSSMLSIIWHFTLYKLIRCTHPLQLYTVQSNQTFSASESADFFSESELMLCHVCVKWLNCFAISCIHPSGK